MCRPPRRKLASRFKTTSSNECLGDVLLWHSVVYLDIVSAISAALSLEPPPHVKVLSRILNLTAILVRIWVEGSYSRLCEPELNSQYECIAGL